MSKKTKDPKLTPMMRQYFEIKNRHPDKYLFFRLGDFYEMFDRDAIEVSAMLQIALTERHQIPMCGIPHHQLHRYAHKVITQGKKIVIVEQEKPAPGATLFTRKIAQIITPGTTVDEMNLAAQEKNFIVSFYFHKEGGFFPEKDAGLIALDTTTGEVIFETVDDGGGTSLKGSPVYSLKRSLNRFFENYTPTEVVLPDSFRDHELVGNLVKEYPHLIINYWAEPTPEQVKCKISSLYSQLDWEDQNSSTYSLYKGLFILLAYTEQNFGEKITYLQAPRKVKPHRFLTLDQQTLVHLEIFKNNFDHTRKYSLLSVIDYTRTSMGSRKLQERLALPSRDQKVIERWLQQTDFLYQNPLFLKEIRGWMSHIADIERISTRLALKKVFPRDFLSLKQSLILVSKLLTAINDKSEKNSNFLFKIEIPTDRTHSTHSIVTDIQWGDVIETLQQIVQKIEATIVNEPVNDLSKGNFINPNAHPRLQEYYRVKTQAEKLLSQLESQEKSKTGIATLRIRYNDNLGYFFEASKSAATKVPPHFLRKQSLVSAERFVSEELLKLDAEIREARENSVGLEKEIFEELRKGLEKNIPLFQEISHFIAQVDVAGGFAELASVRSWTKPVIVNSTESQILKITGGRHPVVEAEFKDPFIPNDIAIGNQEDMIQIITGPNMSGKSTFLRQNAIIVILGHLGSFVPATTAAIPLCDQIFTRIGSGDRLFQGESTFLVEMQETARILNQMTPKSLVIMDEIGRGTSTYDGLALAWSILEYINHHPEKRAKTLFATHYHELISLTREEGITHYHVTIREAGDKIIFLKKVVKGVTSRSYGIQVAKLAGLPEEVVAHARNLLKALEEKQEQVNADEISRQLKDQGMRELLPQENHKQDKQEIDDIVKEIEKFDVNSHSPLESTQFLLNLQKKIEKNNRDE